MAVVFNSLKEKFGCHYQAVCSSDNQDVLTPSTEIDGQKDWHVVLITAIKGVIYQLDSDTQHNNF